MTPVSRDRVDDRYAPLWAQCEGHPGVLLAAGWFDDGVSDAQREDMFALDLLTTPVHRLDIRADRNNLVLVGMGSFAPIHAGHLAMMTSARDALMGRGHYVAGGYVSPSHDGYVLTKPGVTLPIGKRIDLAIAATAPGWLMVGPWEGQWVPVALNLTTVLDRTEAYLRRLYPGRRIEAVGVFGSDNVGFCGAFIEMGRFVCVSRDPDHDTLTSEAFACPDRGLFARGREVVMSSTRVRAEAVDIIEKTDDDETFYVIRDDLALSAPVPVTPLDMTALAALLSRFAPRPVHVISAQAQVDWAHEQLRGPIVSLDVHLRGHLNYGVTRLFETSSPQLHPEGLVPRGERALVGAVPPGSYTLVDDGQASGFTRGVAVAALRQRGVIVDQQVFLNTPFIPEDEVFDIVDARDFLLFSKEGGLTLRLPDGQIARAPYISPFVDLTSRAKISRAHHLTLSDEILAWNAEIFARTPDARISLGQPRQIRWAETLGFHSEDRVLDLIAALRRRIGVAREIG